MVARIEERSYAERRVQVFPGGFVQQHTLQGRRTHDGAPVRLPCAIICQVSGGKINRLDEYFDSAHVAEFRKFA
jgi:ketosteroid isomerase-like protein